jgi:hypothetical protein
VVVEAAPSATFEVSEPDLLLELLIIALNAPAQLGNIDERRKIHVIRQVESQYLVGSFSPTGHSISNHSSSRGAVSFSSRCTGRTRRRTKRKDSGAASVRCDSPATARPGQHARSRSQDPRHKPQTAIHCHQILDHSSQLLS